MYREHFNEKLLESWSLLYFAEDQESICNEVNEKYRKLGYYYNLEVVYCYYHGQKKMRKKSQT